MCLVLGQASIGCFTQLPVYDIDKTITWKTKVVRFTIYFTIIDIEILRTLSCTFLDVFVEK